MDGTAPLGQPVALDGNGVATLEATLSFRVHLVTASYAGDANFAGSTNACAANPNIITVAGGLQGYSGDNGPATAAAFWSPEGVAVDAAGDVFISDTGNNVVREVNQSTGVITTVAGTGSAGYTGDGDQATSAELSSPIGLAVDNEGDLFIADLGNWVVREVNIASGVISTVAGGGSLGYYAGGVPATAAATFLPPVRRCRRRGRPLFIGRWLC